MTDENENRDAPKPNVIKFPDVISQAPNNNQSAETSTQNESATEGEPVLIPRRTMIRNMFLAAGGGLAAGWVGRSLLPEQRELPITGPAREEKFYSLKVQHPDGKEITFTSPQNFSKVEDALITTFPVEIEADKDTTFIHASVLMNGFFKRYKETKNETELSAEPKSEQDKHDDMMIAAMGNRFYCYYKIPPMGELNDAIEKSPNAAYYKNRMKEGEFDLVLQDVVDEHIQNDGPLAEYRSTFTRMNESNDSKIVIVDNQGKPISSQTAYRNILEVSALNDIRDKLKNLPRDRITFPENKAEANKLVDDMARNLMQNRITEIEHPGVIKN